MVTTPQNSLLSRARSLLAALAGSGGSSALPAAEALAVIDDVQPPYPPPLPATGVRERPALTEVLEALTEAASAAADPSEATRIAAAAAAFRTPFPG